MANKRGRPAGKVYTDITSFGITQEQREILEHTANVCGMRPSEVLRDMIDNCLLPTDVPYEFTAKCNVELLIQNGTTATTALQFVAMHLGEDLESNNKIRGITIDISPEKGVTPVLQAIKSVYRILTNEAPKSICDGTAGDSTGTGSS